MQTQKHDLWKIENQSEISICWAKGAFTNVTIVAWRDILIKINTTSIGGKGGWPPRRMFKLLIDDKCYSYEEAYHNDLLKKKHEICNGTHFLTFLMSAQSIVLRERPVHPTFSSKADFSIVLCQDYESTTDEPIEVEEEKDLVTLFELNESGNHINSDAYFEEGSLVIDYWILGGNYEDEKFITIKKKDLPLMYEEFKIVPRKKKKLLQTLLSIFQGEDCFRKCEEFLELKKIPFEYTVRYD